MTEAQQTIDRNDHLGGLRAAVTGGTSGLGLALVRLLKRQGAEVAFVARTAHDVARVSEETGAVGVVGDVGNKADIHPIALQINGSLGGLNVLIDNASSLGPVPLSYLGDTDCEDLEEALRVNVAGPFRLTKALFGALAASARQGGAATRRPKPPVDRSAHELTLAKRPMTAHWSPPLAACTGGPSQRASAAGVVIRNSAPISTSGFSSHLNRFQPATATSPRKNCHIENGSCRSRRFPGRGAAVGS